MAGPREPVAAVPFPAQVLLDRSPGGVVSLGICVLQVTRRVSLVDLVRGMILTWRCLLSTCDARELEGPVLISAVCWAWGRQSCDVLCLMVEEARLRKVPCDTAAATQTRRQMGF